MRAIIIIALVVVVLVVGLFTLRGSAKTGMPGEDVLKRAGERAREQKRAEDADPKDDP
jgi:uncharacterized membrane protein